MTALKYLGAQNFLFETARNTTAVFHVCGWHKGCLRFELAHRVWVDPFALRIRSRVFAGENCHVQTVRLSRTVLAASAFAGIVGVFPMNAIAAAKSNATHKKHKMSATNTDGAVRRFRIEVPQDALSTCAGASRPRGGLTRKRYRMLRKAFSSRPCRNSRAIGRRSTIGAGAKRNSTRCRTSSLKSMCDGRESAVLPLVVGASQAEWREPNGECQAAV